MPQLPHQFLHSSFASQIRFQALFYQSLLTTNHLNFIPSSFILFFHSIMAIVTRLLSCTLLALLLLHGHLVQVRADQQQQPSESPQSSTHYWQQSSVAQPTPSNSSSNGRYGNDNKPGDVGTSSWQPDDKQPSYPVSPGQGPPPPGQGPPPPSGRPYPGHGPDDHRNSQYPDKPQVLWGQCTFFSFNSIDSNYIILCLCKKKGGGYYYKGTTKCTDGSYCRYFSDCMFHSFRFLGPVATGTYSTFAFLGYSQCNPNDHHY